jgi:putative transposase
MKQAKEIKIMIKVKYNPDIHHRKSIRLKYYDYSSNDAYFITICTQNREYYFQEFPILAEIVKEQWEKLEERFDNLILDEFIIMPNHIHGILFLGGQPNPSKGVRVIAPTIAPKDNTTDFSTNTSNKKQTLGDIVGAFKSLCVKEWLKYIKK